MASLRLLNIVSGCAMLLPDGVRGWLIRSTQASFTVGVSAVVVNERDEILLLRHRFRESHSWELPGGFVERGESLEAAISREIGEETGLDIDIVSHLVTRIARARHVDVAYLVRSGPGAFRLDGMELLDAHFFPPNALPPVLSHEQLNVIRFALGLLDKPTRL